MNIRLMSIDDYEKVYELWMSCVGMGINILDDSKSEQSSCRDSWNRHIKFIYTDNFPFVRTNSAQTAERHLSRLSAANSMVGTNRAAATRI